MRTTTKTVTIGTAALAAAGLLLPLLGTAPAAAEDARPTRATVATADSGPAVPFGSHTFPYAAGTLKPSGTQSALDQAVIKTYNAWKSAFVKKNCGNGWYQVISPDADHPYVAEAQGYGMVVTATMAGPTRTRRPPSTAWSSTCWRTPR